MICARISATPAKPMPVYLDHNATSPTHPRVLDAIRVSSGMDNSLQDVEMLIVKLQDLINKLPTVIRQAAV